MKNKKIIEAYDKMLPGKERHDRNLEEVISRLEAQGYDGTSIYEGEDRSGRSSGAQIITVRKKSWKTVAAAAAVLAVVVSLAVNTEVLANVRGWFRHFRENDSNTIVYEFYEDNTGKKLPQIIIGWLPEEFEGAEPIDTSNAYRFSRVYVHDNKLIDFTIDYMHQGGKMFIIPEEGEDLILEEMIINGNKAELWYDSESCCLNVFDDINGILIGIDSNIEKEGIIRIAENIQFVFE